MADIVVYVLPGSPVPSYTFSVRIFLECDFAINATFVSLFDLIFK